jgi:cell division protein FtsA
MIARAFVSGRLGKVLYAENGVYYLLGPDGQTREARSADLESVFSRGAEFELVEQVTLDSLKAQLERQIREHSVFFLLTSVIDFDLSISTRLSSAQAAETLLHESHLNWFVLHRFFSKPLPVEYREQRDQLNQLLVEFPLVRSALREVFEAQPVLDNLWSSWYAAANGQDVERSQRSDVETELIARGFFPLLLVALRSGGPKALDSTFNFFLGMSSLDPVLPNFHELLGAFRSSLKSRVPANLEEGKLEITFKPAMDLLRLSPARQQRCLTAIDVGSSAIRALVGEVKDAAVYYRGHGVTESRGSSRGVVVDLDKAMASIQKAVEAAEDSAGMPIERAVVGIGGAHVRGMNSHGGISLGTRPREIGREEIKLVLDKARSIPLPPDREIIHLLPQEFILDDQAGIHDPLGMVGERLEVRVHIVTVAGSATQKLITAVNRAGVLVDDIVFEPLAASDSVLHAEERELGICLADIGASSTELIVFRQGVVAYAGTIPVGGDHFTRDLSVGLVTPLAEAEKIKKAYGNAMVTLVKEGNEVEVSSIGDRPSRMVPQRLVAEILEPRASELFEMLRESLRVGGVFEECVAGFVLSGGAARLSGIVDAAESVLKRPVRLSWPTPLSKMPASLVDPEFATVLGIVLYGRRARIAEWAQEDRWASWVERLQRR